MKKPPPPQKNPPPPSGFLKKFLHTVNEVWHALSRQCTGLPAPNSQPFSFQKGRCHISGCSTLGNTMSCRQKCPSCLSPFLHCLCISGILHLQIPCMSQEDSLLR